MPEPRPAKQPWNKSSKLASFKGTRGLADAVLVLGSLLFAAVVFGLLLSVLWSVITSGASAMSSQFILQNNRYISTTTSLEYGGVGHAILGTLELVLQVLP